MTDYNWRVYSFIIGYRIGCIKNNKIILIIVIIVKSLLLKTPIKNHELINSRDVNPEFIVECIYFEVKKNLISELEK